MIRKYFFIGILCVFSFPSFSQDSTAYDKFLRKLVSGYENAYPNHEINIFEILVRIAKNEFNPGNDLFVPALNYWQTKNNLKEPEALDILWQKAENDILQYYLWNAVEEIYKTNLPLFEIYNKALCACVTEKLKLKDDMPNMDVVSQQCITNLVTDSTYINSIRSIAGGNTFNDMYKLRAFMVRYLYGNCDIIFTKFNEAVANSYLYDGYYSGLTKVMKKKAGDVIRLYKGNKTDSLKKLFPAYKTYIPEIRKIIAVEKKRGIQNSKYCRVNTGEKNPPIEVFYRNNDGLSGEAVFIPSSNTLSATIQSLSVKTYTPAKKGGDEIIIEEEVISTKPIKKN